MWLKQQTSISHSSGGRKCKIKVPADSVPGEGPLPGLQTAVFLLRPHIGVVGGGVCGRGKGGGERRQIEETLLIRALNSSGGPTLMSSSKPNHLPKVLSPDIITLGLRLQHMDLERGDKIQPIANALIICLKILCR